MAPPLAACVGAVLILFLIQPFEFGRDGGTIVLLIHSAAAVALVAFSVFLSRGRINSAAIMIAMIVFVYLVLLNLRDPAQFSTLGCVFVFLTTFASGQLTATQPEILRKSLTLYIVFNVIGFTITWALGSIFGYYPDLHQLLFPFSEARILSSHGIVRVTGFHLEPGTYAQWTMMAVCMRSLLVRRFFDVVSGTVLVSLVLTLSAWAIVALLMYCAAGLLNWLARISTANRISYGLKGIAIIGILATCLWIAFSQGTYLDYMLARFELSDSSGVAKAIAANNLFQHLSSVVIVGRPATETFCLDCSSSLDIGVWAALIFHLGLIPFITLLAFATWQSIRVWGVAGAALVCLLMLNKATIFGANWWFFLGMLAAAKLPAFHRQVAFGPIGPSRKLD